MPDEQEWTATFVVEVKVFGSRDHAAGMLGGMQRRLELVHGVGRVNVTLDSVIGKEDGCVGRVGQGPAESDLG